MKKGFFVALSATFILFCFSFGLDGEPKLNYGTFGGDGKNAPKIQINADHTFTYTDLTRKVKPISAKGTWSLKADEILLQPDTDVKLNKHYTLIREGKCIQTRKVAAIYTLCNCN
jgi:hypothetical protein